MCPRLQPREYQLRERTFAAEQGRGRYVRIADRLSRWTGSGVTADLGTYRGTGFTNIIGFENIVGSAQGDLLTGDGART